MKHTPWTTLAGLALVLAMAGCTQAATGTPIPTIALDSGTLQARNEQASAEVVPAQETRLSFVIPGPIKEVNVEEGSVVDPGQTLATLSSPDLEYGILQAEDTVNKAEFDYQYWKLPRRQGNQIIDRGQVAAQELESTRRSLDTAYAELSQTELVAPFAATVVSVSVKPGEFVQAGQVVLVLAKLDNLHVETTDLSELNVASVKVGQAATVHVEALGKDIPGVVTAISPISDKIGGDVVFKVTIELNEQPKELLWGMSADVEIQTEQ
jgi:RND family efflux transporter MFP subunit